MTKLSPRTLAILATVKASKSAKKIPDELLLHQRTRNRATKYGWDVETAIEVAKHVFDTDPVFTELGYSFLQDHLSQLSGRRGAVTEWMTLASHKELAVIGHLKMAETWRGQSHRTMRKWVGVWAKMCNRHPEVRQLFTPSLESTLFAHGVALPLTAVAWAEAAYGSLEAVKIPLSVVDGQPFDPRTTIAGWIEGMQNVVSHLTLFPNEHLPMLKWTTALLDPITSSTPPGTVLGSFVVGFAMLMTGRTLSRPRIYPSVISRLPDEYDIANITVAALLSHLEGAAQDSRIVKSDADHHGDQITEHSNTDGVSEEYLDETLDIPCPEQDLAETSKSDSIIEALLHLDQEWLDYEMDTEAYFLTKPSLRDNTLPAVKAYHDAMYDLREIVTSIESGDTSEDTLSRGEEIAERALTQWGEANDYAIRVGVFDLTPLERVALRRLHGLVAQLSDPATPRPMWSNLIATINREMAKLTTVPVKWRAVEMQPGISQTLLQEIASKNSAVQGSSIPIG